VYIVCQGFFTYFILFQTILLSWPELILPDIPVRALRPNNTIFINGVLGIEVCTFQIAILTSIQNLKHGTCKWVK
jgi:hypothetical protein